MLYFRLRGLSRDNLSQLWILNRRDLEFCIYGTLAYADTVEVNCEGHIRTNRKISKNKRHHLLLKAPNKMQDQGLSGYSAAPLTSSAPLRLGKCRLSWVGLGFRCFRLSACSGRGCHRHTSSGFVSDTHGSELTGPCPYVCL